MIRALGVAVVLCLPAPLFAQQFSLLIGGIRAEYADTLAGTAGLLSATLEGEGRHGRGELSASLARFTSSEMAIQLGAQGALVAALGARGLAGGILAGGSFNQVEGGIWSGAFAAGPYLARSAGPVLASLSITIGAVRSVDSTSLAPATATAGLRYQPGRWRLETIVTGTTADTTRYLDFGLSTGIRTPALHVSASAGVRAGDLQNDPWWQLRADWTLAPWATLESAVGAYPSDLTGFTEGQFVTIGLRVVPAPSRPAPRGGAQPVAARRLSPQRVLVSLTFRDARTVAIAGEWNQWNLIPMRRDGAARWVAELPLRPGVYRYALLVNDDQWTVPPGVATATDDLGGQVALLIVPDR